MLLVVLLLVVAVSAPTVAQPSNEEDETELVQGIDHDILIPSYSFEFRADLIVLPSLPVKFIVDANINSIDFKEVFIHSFLEMLLEHHIAINAP